MTIHLRIFGTDEEVPKEGYALLEKEDGWIQLLKDKKFVGTSMRSWKPFLEELMALARRGQEYDKLMEDMRTPGAVIEVPQPNVTFKHPDPLISAIRDVGAGIVEAIGEHAGWTMGKCFDRDAAKREINERFTAIAERVRGE